MALFAAAAHRAATCSLPLLRASVSRDGISLLRLLVAAAARPMPFSAATAMKPSSSGELLRASKSEVKLAERCHDHDRDEEQDESSSDESSPSLLESLPSADESSSSSVKNQEDKGGDHPKKHGTPFMITVYKADDSSVQFSCTNYTRGNIVINALAMRPPPCMDVESDLGFDFTASDEVVEFSQLDEDLQRSLYELIKPFGPDNPVVTQDIHEDRMSKGRRLFWERQLWAFVNKD